MKNLAPGDLSRSDGAEKDLICVFAGINWGKREEGMVEWLDLACACLCVCVCVFVCVLFNVYVYIYIEREIDR